jgi:glutamate formiminotransferase
LVAFNVWLADPDVALAQRVAVALRSPAIRALGLSVGRRVQVSMNLVDPLVVGPAAAYDAVAALAPVAGGELVGLIPAAVLEHVPQERWAELDLGPDRTIEARLALSTWRLRTSGVDFRHFGP